MIKADLHIHSKISDGSDTVDRIVEIAKEKGLTHISITDHDIYIDHTSLFIKIISGIEISSIDKASQRKAHILGYSINDPTFVNDLCKPLLENRHKNCLRQIEILRTNGFSINIDQINKADDKYIYKQHIMEYLVNMKQVETMFGDFYRNTFKNGGICDFDIEYINVLEAVKAIKNGGGYAVLAHCGQQQNFDLIPKLVKIGLDGLELNHLGNSENDKIKIREYASKYNLLLTGGSDYHGIYEAEKVAIGEYLSEEKVVEIIENV
ncbi:MAG TPA: PHP domain-containing protein [Ruminiclostridium sp.]